MSHSGIACHIQIRVHVVPVGQMKCVRFLPDDVGYRALRPGSCPACWHDHDGAAADDSCADSVFGQLNSVDESWISWIGETDIHGGFSPNNRAVKTAAFELPSLPRWLQLAG